MHPVISFCVVVGAVTIRRVLWHLLSRSPFSLFQLILAQRIGQVTFTNGFALPKYVLVLLPFQYVIIIVFLVNLLVVLC